jgi:hypothetical protein
VKFEALLGRSVRGFWATSYSFDLMLFDQYLLRRLAESPLNAVVLIDHDKLSAGWESLHDGETYLAKQAGRRYLLRGVRSHAGGAFHPKTYLFARADHATLVVGSGNLTRDGIDHGKESFASFTTQDATDLPSMRAWARWMSGLVEAQGDDMLSERWRALREGSPWMVGADDGSSFVHNARRPLMEQLVDRLPADVTELHVKAPFFDRDAVALRRLLEAAAPDRVTLYVGAGCSVHGPSLQAVLGQAPAVRLRRFEPSRFVHAKLVGAVGADGSGVVLCGSANLSRAALLLTDGVAGGNQEAGVIQHGDADEVRRLFEASGLDLVDEPLEWLDDLEYDDSHPTLDRSLVLASARWRADGRIQVSSTKPLPPGCGLVWDDTSASSRLDTDGVTDEVLSESDPLPVLVALADETARPLSNRVVVDDPAALRDTLLGRSNRGSSRPPELEGLELAPLIQLVLWAHDKFIFDPDDTPAFRRAQQATEEILDAEEAGDFWERYATEELQHDPRHASYRPLTVGTTTAQPVDELLRELQLLLHGAPSLDTPLVLRVLTAGPSPAGDDHRDRGTPWSMDARQRVRAYRLLTRWAAAIADPRHALVAAHAPVVNYETLIGILVLGWVNDALDLRQSRSLLLDLLSAFVGGNPGQGFLGQAPDEVRERAITTLDPGFVEIAAGLVYVALTAPGWGADIYNWQPTLARAIELGVVLPGPLSESTVRHATGESASVQSIDELLAQRVSWADDSTWCERLADELGLGHLRLARFNPPRVPVVVVVTGDVNALKDTRLLTVARRALKFKEVGAIAVSAGDDRFVFEPDAPARARVDGRGYTTDGPVTVSRLLEIEQQGGAWADLLGVFASPPLRNVS